METETDTMDITTQYFTYINRTNETDETPVTLNIKEKDSDIIFYLTIGMYKIYCQI